MNAPAPILKDGLRYSHEAIVDLMLQHPNWDQNTIARYLNLTPVWLSRVIHTDAFRDYYNRRRDEHNSNVSESVIDNMQELAIGAIKLMKSKIENENGEEVSPRIVLETIAVASKALGYGGHSNQGAPTVQVNINHVDSSLLARARDRLRANQEIRGTPMEQLEVLPSTS